MFSKIFSVMESGHMFFRHLLMGLFSFTSKIFCRSGLSPCQKSPNGNFWLNKFWYISLGSDKKYSMVLLFVEPFDKPKILWYNEFMKVCYQQKVFNYFCEAQKGSCGLWKEAPILCSSYSYFSFEASRLYVQRNAWTLGLLICKLRILLAILSCWMDY